jgi:dihydrofolate reductase
MSKVFVDLAMSLDGFIGGSNGEDHGLHNWYFAPSEASQAVITELIENIGAMVMGRRSYQVGSDNGAYDEKNPYKIPHFVLSRTITKRRIEGKTPMFFIADGLQSCLDQAKAAAGKKDVCISGGADIAQQFIQAGMVDEIRIHLVPIIINKGLRLFENLDGQIKLRQTQVIESIGVTHLRFDVIKNP